MSLRFGHTSLKFTYQFASYGLFLIILLFGSIALLKINVSTDLSNQIIQRSINQMDHAMNLRIAAAGAAMPVNDYIIHASEEEKNLYVELRDQVEARFDKMASMPGFMPGQLEVLSGARAKWNKAKRVADAIIAIKQPVGDPKAAALMEDFDLLIDQASEELKRLYDVVYAENLKSNEHIQDIAVQTYVLAGFLFLAALGIVGYGSYWMPRAFFPPIRDVAKAMQRLQQGDLDCRVERDVPIEFISLVDGFNEMADTLRKLKRD